MFGIFENQNVCLAASPPSLKRMSYFGANKPALQVVTCRSSKAAS
jgi:hypothetical protein